MNCRFWLPVAISLITCLGSGLAAAQEFDVPVELQETDRLGMGARAAGMGGAVTATIDDVTSLYFNPAGLAFIRSGEFSTGVQFNRQTRDMTHVQTNSASTTPTRLEHLAGAWPLRRHGRAVTLGFGFHTLAGVQYESFKEGFVIEPTDQQPGLFEVDAFNRQGSVQAITTGLGLELSDHVTLGGTFSFLLGKTSEQVTTANYRATLNGNLIEFDLGSPSNPDERLFEQLADRQSSMSGITGSLGIQVVTDPGLRLGGVIEFPRAMAWTGSASFLLEDTEKVDTFYGVGFRDEITLPLTLRGGAAYQRPGFTLSADIRWTDYRDIDFEGPILAPPEGNTFQRTSAYRSVVAWSAGAEVLIPGTQVTARGGLFTQPLPYRLMLADPNFKFEPAGPENDGYSVLERDYPTMDTISDRLGWSLGIGVTLEEMLTFDLAYQQTQWDRSTPVSYENSTTYYPTWATIESVVDRQVFVTARVALPDRGY